MLNAMWRLALLLGGCGFSASLGSHSGDDGGVTSDTPGGGGALVPSNVTDTSGLDDADLPDLILDDVDPDAGPCAWRIYTDTGQIEHGVAGVDMFATYRAPGLGEDATTHLTFAHIGSTMAVLYVDQLVVRAPVRFEGYGPRSLIILAKGTIDVQGELDFSAGFVAPGSADSSVDFAKGGPGGGDGGTNDQLGTVVDMPAGGCGRGTTGGGGGGDDGSGGGGGGGGLVGQKGGDKAAPSDVGGPGGAACLTPALIPLLGGAGGGAGDVDGGGGEGGGGGGAIQLTSLASISITGIIDVGGKGGRAQQLNDEGGGGGGAGGGILVEAPTVTIEGAVLAANGGGGGSGRELNHGAQGTLTTAPANGGLGSGGSNNDGRGGNGGAGSIAATAGDDHNPGGGGGGGAVGVIRINTDSGAAMGTAGVISPPLTTGTVIYQ